LPLTLDERPNNRCWYAIVYRGQARSYGRSDIVHSVISIIVPTLNEAACIAAALAALDPFRKRGAEIIVVDGGSNDATAAIASAQGAKVVTSAAGRARQQNAGATAARGDILLFLHVDTQLPSTAYEDIERALANPATAWGRFDVTLRADPEPGPSMLRVVAGMMNLRSLLTGIATGDQAIFVRKSVFVRVGGFPEIALMEDIALSRLLKKIAQPVCVRSRVETSARRWQTQGIWRTIVLMWSLRLGYWCGVSPETLSRWYRHVR
jgi:rSAM/selenodomain-associated transferase 2